MTRPSAAQVERARQLLALEGASDPGAATCPEAAARVLDKLDAQLAPLLGRVGVQTLFARSAKLAQAEVASLAGVAAGPDGSTTLRACLLALQPAAAATEAAAVLFGTFLDLITTFIGERLTVQVLRGAWPAIEETVPRETPT